MNIYESAAVEIEGKKIVVVRVPDEALGDMLRSGDVINEAQLRFQRDPVLVGRQSGRLVGPLHLVRLLRTVALDILPWSEWHAVS